MEAWPVTRGDDHARDDVPDGVVSEQPDVPECVVAYLNEVARQLERRGVVVRSIEMRGGAPVTGRLLIADRTASGVPRDPARLALVWHDNAGWSTEWMLESGEWPTRSRRFVDDPYLPPATVACLVADIMTV